MDNDIVYKWVSVSETDNLPEYLDKEVFRDAETKIVLSHTGYVYHRALNIFQKTNNNPQLSKLNYQLSEIEWLKEIKQPPPNINKWISEFKEVDKARFWGKMIQGDYCWEWQGAKNSDGYGQFKINNKNETCSRIAYQLINGVLPDGVQVLHKCDNPGCINPDHLFTGTHQDNMNDKLRKGRGKILGRSSKYIGVSFRKDSKSWRAYLTVNGKHDRIGCFKTEIEAAKARDEEVKKRNINTKLNFE